MDAVLSVTDWEVEELAKVFAFCRIPPVSIDILFVTKKRTEREMEGGEWNSFNGVYVNEEADFMAQLFPTTTDQVDGHSSLASWSNNVNLSTNSNLGCYFSQDSCYSGGSGIANYPIASHENYYASHNFLAGNNNNGSMLEFCDDKVEVEESGEIEHADNKHFLQKRGSLDLGDNISDCTDISRKRPRVSDARKGRKIASRSKKRQKGGSILEDNNGSRNKQGSNSCSSEDESNLSLELNNGASSNGKSRASRGSATDPQSLYARKRRERINERLKILQTLVPNGTKVDISTMLEEAVQYVKFLQLQIKLLSSDDLWMYAPIAYNGMDIGLNLKLNALT
ncbi:hypothetical protein V2J09_004491 [Rumex salicifolius]